MEATGFRVGATGDFPRVNQPMPGVGIEFENSSAGTVWDSVVTQSLRAGIRADSKKQNVCVAQVNLFDNNPNLQNVSVDEEETRPASSTPGEARTTVEAPWSRRRAEAQARRTCSTGTPVAGFSCSPTARRSASGGFAGRSLASS